MNIDERDRVAQQFGAAPEQVERDHLISHLLESLSERFGDRIHFIGGTALARTHLPNGRLSEDVDLIAVDGRFAVAAELDETLPRAVARTHGSSHSREVVARAIVQQCGRHISGDCEDRRRRDSQDPTVVVAAGLCGQPSGGSSSSGTATLLPQSSSSQLCQRSLHRKRPRGLIAARPVICGSSGRSPESALSTRPR